MKIKNKLNFLIYISLLFCFSQGNFYAQSEENDKYFKIADKLIPALSSSVKIDGYLGEKINSCIENRVMSQSIEKIITPFRLRSENDFGGFRCEYWGKWFTSAMLAYSYQPTPRHHAVIDEAFNELIKTQTADGYIGTYDKQHYLGGWDVWGQKYTLLGLLDYYDQTKDKKALDAACKEVDLLLTKIGPGKINLAENGIPVLQGLAPSSILRAIVLLYERTGNKKYLNFSKYIVNQWDVPNKFTSKGLHLIENALAEVPPVKIDAPKAFEMMSNFEGVLELYTATGENRYLNAAVKFGNSIRKYERMINGSCSNQELWCDGVKEQTEILSEPVETCVTVTWMRYCYQLLRVTGDPVWADELEISLYNAELGAMSPNGYWWSYFSPLIGERVPSHMQHEDVGLSCCVASGPRALLLTPCWAVMGSNNGIKVNLYSQGSYFNKLKDGSDVSIIQETDYPVTDKIKLKIVPSKTGNFTISLRIPGWSKINNIELNGQKIKCKPGTYAEINRIWSAGDEINMNLDLRGRVIPAPSGAPQVAIMRGPILLALDNRFVSPQDTSVWLNSKSDVFKKPVTGTKSTSDPLSEVEPAGYVRVRPVVSTTDAQEYIELEPVKSKPGNIWMAFEVPFLFKPSHFFNHQTKTLVMCDYSSAGNEWSEKNLYRVWLPQPLFLGNLYPSQMWKIMYPDRNDRPAFPGNRF
ncbi:MAG: beta-L-arabinofuranosidase domain-containing protein [Ignavibacteriaceae bacterium]